MANPEKDDFNLDDIQFTDASIAPLVDFSESPASVEPLAAQPAPVASPLEATAPAAIEETGAKKAKKEKKVRERKDVDPSDEEGKPDILHEIAQASPYTVLLGIAVVALLVAVLLMFVELRRYDLDIRATKGKQTLTMNETPARSFADYCLLRSESRDGGAIS